MAETGPGGGGTAYDPGAAQAEALAPPCSTRRSFLGLLLAGLAWAGLPGGQRPHTWTLEWFEQDIHRWGTSERFGWHNWTGWPVTIYIVKASRPGDVRTMTWFRPTAQTREARWNQYLEMKAKMREWAKATLA